MDTSNRVRVNGRKGLRGYAAAGAIEDGTVVQVELDTGEWISIPGELMSVQPDGTYRLAIGPDDLNRYVEHSEEHIIPLAEETLEVDKRTVETGRIRVTTSVQEREHVVDEPLHVDEVEVRRVPIHRYLDAPVPIRTEGDTTIVPVMEEVLVVEKRLLLKEEIHLTRHRRTRHEPQHVLLRSEEAHVERIDPPGPPGGS